MSQRVSKGLEQLGKLALLVLVAAGVDDPQADPRATRAAYERSTREVRLVAMR